MDQRDSSTPNEDGDTAHMGILASNTRPLFRFLGGAWDEARIDHLEVFECAHLEFTVSIMHMLFLFYFVLLPLKKNYSYVNDVLYGLLGLSLLYSKFNDYAMLHCSRKVLFMLMKFPSERLKSLYTNSFRLFGTKLT